MRKSDAPYWLDGHEEHCPECDQRFGHGAGYRCGHCDQILCAICVAFTGDAAFCPACHSPEEAPKKGKR